MSCSAGTAAADEGIAAQSLPTAGLPGFILIKDRPLSPSSLLIGQAPYYRLVADKTIDASHQREWTAYDGSASVHTRVTEFSAHKWTEAARRKLIGPAPAIALPPGAVAVADRSEPGNQVIRMHLAKGRVQAEIVVRVGSRRQGARRYAETLAAQVAQAQYFRLRWSQDRPDADRVSTRPLQIALVISLFAVILVPQLLVGLATYVRDPASRRRLRLRFRPLPPMPAMIPSVAHVDISAEARIRLRRHRRRTVIRTVLVLGLIGATVQLTLFNQLTVLALVALVGATAEAVWHRARRTSGSHALWTWRTLLPALFGAGVTVVLAMAGVGLLYLYVAQLFVGTLPHDSARSFGSFLFGTGMVLIGLSALPYLVTRRLGQRHARAILDRDRRRPVLFLRSWLDDHLRMRAHRTGRHAVLERLSFRRWDRFEEILVAEVWRHGPVVGLAEPGTHLPPLGAVRRAESDQDWFRVVEEYIDDSALILMTVDRTRSLADEMRAIVERGALDKAIFAFPPIADSAERARREGLLCAVVGFPIEAFAAVHGSNRSVLAATWGLGGPTIFIAEVADHVGYEAALAAAAAALHTPVTACAAGSTVPTPTAVPADRVAPMLTIRPRASRPRRPWYLHRVALVGVWLAVLVLGLFKQALKDVPADPPRPALPGGVVASAKSPVALGPGPVVFDAAQPALIDAAGVARPLAMGGEPRDFLVGPAATYVMVETVDYSHRLMAFSRNDTSSRPLWSTDLGEVSLGLAATSDRVFVALPGSDRVAVLDAGTGRWTGSIGVGHAPTSLAVAGGQLYVSNGNDGTLTEIALGSAKEVATVPAGKGPRTIAVVGDRVFVADIIGERITVLAANDLRQVRSLAVPTMWNEMVTDGRVVVAVMSGLGTPDWPELIVFEVATGRTLRRIALPDLPTDLLLDGKDLLIALPDVGRVVRVSLP